MKMTGCDRARSDAVPERDEYNSPGLSASSRLRPPDFWGIGGPPWVSDRIGATTLKGLWRTFFPIFEAEPSRAQRLPGVSLRAGKDRMAHPHPTEKS